MDTAKWVVNEQQQTFLINNYDLVDFLHGAYEEKRWTVIDTDAVFHI